jgi:hypothetical protein
VRNGSVADLAEAIVEVVGDRAAWQRMSAAGPAAIDRLQTDEVGTAWIGLAEEVAGRVALPQRALLVEDLSVDPDGLRVRGVVLGRNPVPAPVTIGTEDRAARTQLSPTSAVGDTDVVSEVAGELPWGEVRRWPVGAALVGVDAQGEPVPIIAPGVPAIAATDRHGVVVVQRDVAGTLRRVAVDQPPVLRVDPARARVLVGEDETWVSEVLAMRGRLVGQGAGDQVELDVGLPGVQLDEESSIPVVARVDADRVRIGLLQPQPAAGQWREGLWTTPALVRWDEGALLDLARRDPPPVPISLGLGGRLRNVGPVDFDGRRPIVLASAEGWLLAPSESGRALLVRGAGLAARTLWHARSLRRAGWTRGRSEDRDPR